MPRRTSIDAKSALSAAPDATLIVDHDGRIVFASDRVRDVFGYTPDELTDQPIERLVPEYVRAAHTESRLSFQAAPYIVPMKARSVLSGLARDGRIFPAEIGLSPIALRQVICVVRDVTSAKDHEAAVSRRIQALETQAAASASDARQREDHLKLFVKHTPAAVAMLDRNMCYLMVSDRWLDDYGLVRRDITGLSHYDLFPEMPEAWRQAYRRALAGETVRQLEDSFLRSNGHREWLRWELCPWYDAGGSVGGILIFTEVITQRKLGELALADSRALLEARVEARTRDLEAARDEAERSTELKSRFLAATAHDLRQPLQATMTYLGLLGRHVVDAGGRDLCDQSRAQLQAMADILDTLLDLSRLERGATLAHPGDIDVQAVVRRVVDLHRPLAEARGLRLRQTGEACIGRSDPALLERILANLVSNALRYTVEGDITVSCTYVDDGVEIAVADTGIGIAPDAIKAIFDDYVQVDNPARDRSKGLGLGLSIVRSIAAGLGHPIEVFSREGQGSTFRLRLPRGARPGAPPDRTAAGPVASGHLDILLVEDDPAVAESTAMVLRLEGMDIRLAGDCRAAVKAVETGFRPDVVLSDFRLPDGNGLELIGTVRGRLGTPVPAILLTGDIGVRNLDLPAGCERLQKPVPLERLITAVRQAAASSPPAK